MACLDRLIAFFLKYLAYHRRFNISPMHQTVRALCLLPRVAGDASPFAIEFSVHEDDKDEVSNPDEDGPRIFSSPIN